MADWNRDGHPDLLVSGPLSIAHGPLGGKEKVTMKRLWPKGKEVARLLTDPVLTDWDGDGLIDLIGGTRLDDPKKGSLNGDDVVYWWRNTGTKEEPKLGTARELVRVTGHDYPSGVAVADWNADGKLDLIVSRVDRNGYEKDWSINHHKIWVYLRK